MRSIDVTAGVVRRGHEMLIARRAPHDSMPGTWEFPGGTVELGESTADCVIRELAEETSLEVSLVRELGQSRDLRPGLELRLHFFELRYERGDVRLVDHDDHAWVDLDGLSGYAFPPADLPVVGLWQSAGSVVPWTEILESGPAA